MNYTKVDVNSPEVVALVKETGFSAKEVAAMINNNRYRQAYNKVKQERDKLLRGYLKEHPELLKGETR